MCFHVAIPVKTQCMLSVFAHCLLIHKLVHPSIIILSVCSDRCSLSLQKTCLVQHNLYSFIHSEPICHVSVHGPGVHTFYQSFHMSSIIASLVSL